MESEERSLASEKALAAAKGKKGCKVTVKEEGDEAHLCQDIKVRREGRSVSGSWCRLTTTSRQRDEHKR